MSKGRGKCEADLQEMTAERNHWRELARARGAELEEIRRQEERRMIMLNALTKGAMPQIDEAIAKLQDERDTAEANLRYLQQLIIRALEKQAGEFEREKVAAENAIHELNELIGEQDMPIIVMVLQEMAGFFREFKQEEWSESRNQIVQATNSEYDPALIISHLCEVSDAKASWTLAKLNAHYAYDFVHDKRAIAWGIIDELRRFDDPPLTTLELLGDEWIQENLPDPPAKLDTLATGLRTRAQELMSGKKREEFAIGTATPRQLLKYQGWYDTIERFAKLRPSVFWETEAG